MNPKIAENWEVSLKALNAAKTAFEKNGEADIKKELCIAIFYGQLMTKDLGQGGEGSIAADTVIESFEQLFNGLGNRQAIDITLKALKEYHNLAPKEYNLPAPTDC